MSDNETTRSEQNDVVVIGAGFGGLAMAKAVGDGGSS